MRGREPGVAVRVELVREAGVQVVAVGHRPQARDVEVRLLEVTAELGQHAADQLLGPRVVDEGRLQLRQDLDEPLGLEALLGHRRLVRGKRVLAEGAGERHQAAGALARGVGEEIAVIEQATASPVVEIGVQIDRRHGRSSWVGARFGGASNPTIRDRQTLCSLVRAQMIGSRCRTAPRAVAATCRRSKARKNGACTGVAPLARKRLKRLRA